MKKLIIKDYVQQEMDKLRQTVVNPPSLLIIDATDGDVGNQIYIRKKVEDFQALGWPVKVIVPNDDYEFYSLLHDDKYDCIIAQMPVSDRFHINVVDELSPAKDCDGLTRQSLVMPATVRGIIDYLDECEFLYSGKTAVVLGRSEIVGKPMAKALLDRDMTIVQCHSKTPWTVESAFLQDADLVVSATGRARSIHRIDCPKAIVVDVGISRAPSGKITGDFMEMEKYCKYGAWSTPVPGGVGLLTRLGLIKNCVDLVNRNQISFENEYQMRLLEDTL